MSQKHAAAVAALGVIAGCGIDPVWHVQRASSADFGQLQEAATEWCQRSEGKACVQLDQLSTTGQQVVLSDVLTVSALDNDGRPGVAYGFFQPAESSPAGNHEAFIYLATDAPCELRWNMLHELGHFFGVGHTNDPTAVMTSGWTELAAPHLTSADMRAYCQANGCREQNGRAVW